MTISKTYTVGGREFTYSATADTLEDLAEAWALVKSQDDLLLVQHPSEEELSCPLEDMQECILGGRKH